MSLAEWLGLAPLDVTYGEFAATNFHLFSLCEREFYVKVLKLGSSRGTSRLSRLLFSLCSGAQRVFAEVSERSAHARGESESIYLQQSLRNSSRSGSRDAQADV